MKKTLCLLISVTLLLSPFLPKVEAVTNDRMHALNSVEAESETDRVIVKLDTDFKANSLAEYEVVESPVEQNVMAIEVPTHQSTEDFIEELEDRKDVVFAEPDHLIQLSYTPSDPSYFAQWHHQTIQTETAWEKSKGSDEVVVAVIDNGMDLNHPDLRDRVVSPYDVVNGTSHSIYPGEHGTHVAGIIASSMDNGYGGSGVAPHARIMPINVFNGDSAYTSDVVQGIYYAVEAGAKIINLSLGSYDYSLSLDLAIQYAHQSGVVIVAAAGNDSTSKRSYPASFDNVISVSSTTPSDSVSYFTNYGSDIDVAAPGSRIYSTLPNGSYGYMSGTSMAAPIVTGVAALIWSSERNLTNKELVNRIFETADDLGPNGKDAYYGHGRVNAKNALHVKDSRQLEINEVTDYDTSVTGTILDDMGPGTVEVRNEHGIIGSSSASSYSTFSVPIPKQPAGTVLHVVLVDSYGNASVPVQIKVTDRTPPVVSKVSEVRSTSKWMTGQAEPDTRIEVKAASTLIGAGQTKVDGTFEVSIPVQNAGTRLSIVAIDQAGNASAVTMIVVKDATPPVKPIVNEVTDKSLKVTGKAEAGSKIEIKGNGSFIGKGTTGTDGFFSINISAQKAGVKLSITSIDSAGNVSPAQSMTVLDKTAPAMPTVNVVSDKSKEVSGKTEVGAGVTITIGSKKYSANADAKGNYKVVIPMQKASTKLTVTAKDKASNVSKGKGVVVLDKTPPPAPNLTTTVKSTTKELKGIAERHSTITIKVGKKVIGTGKTDSKGNFKVKIKAQKKKTALTITATDQAKNISKATVLKVK